MNRMYTEFVKTRYLFGRFLRRCWKQLGSRGGTSQIKRKFSTANEEAVRVVEELIIAAGGEEEVIKIFKKSIHFYNKGNIII